MGTMKEDTIPWLDFDGTIMIDSIARGPLNPHEPEKTVDVVIGRIHRRIMKVPLSIAMLDPWIAQAVQSTRMYYLDTAATEVANISPAAFYRVIQFLATGDFDIKAQVPNWIFRALKRWEDHGASSEDELSVINGVDNTLLLESSSDSTSSFIIVKKYGQRYLSRAYLSELCWKGLETHSIGVDATKLELKIATYTLAFLTLDDLLDYLLHIISARKLNLDVMIALENATDLTRWKANYGLDVYHFPDVDKKISLRCSGALEPGETRDLVMDIRSHAFKLRLLNHAVEVYRAAKGLQVVSMFPKLFEKVKHIMENGTPELEMELAQLVYVEELHCDEALAAYVGRMMDQRYRIVCNRCSDRLRFAFHFLREGKFLNYACDHDLDFERDFRGSLCTALDRGGFFH
ncbi:hypothetical protein BU16DRAFT_584454 [Lophium mytilinum]|uniref:Uncharacterized protein n=1 Tax=Lophium mytilinum TaxID=390894 RepID=A0A6A6QN65_9PEZI|nr:hypothetical protein BU16DRAFT_584454 [Lophium mytilinum]